MRTRKGQLLIGQLKLSTSTQKQVATVKQETNYQLRQH